MNRTDKESPLILVVDDNEDGRDLVCECLLHVGMQVAEAATGPEAIEKAFELRPDVVVLDLSLPGLDGWEVARQLRGDERTQDLVLIALTAHALREPLLRAEEAGCNATITKPFNFQELRDEIHRLLGQGGNSERAST